jgi:deoxyhypusine synthase
LKEKKKWFREIDNIEEIPREYRKLESLDLSRVSSVADLIDGFERCSLEARRIAHAARVLEKMVEDKECFKVLTLSGIMTVAKMGLVIADMIDNGWVNAIISTGAIVSHGTMEPLGLSHFEFNFNMDDETLFKQGLNRVYDTLEPEANFIKLESIIEQLLDSWDEKETLCSYRLCENLGKFFMENSRHRNFLTSAYRKKVPIFIPAFTDCELGLYFGIHNEINASKRKEKIKYDPFIDLSHYADLILRQKRTGIFTVGGGVPRNWAQQIGPYLQIKARIEGHDDDMIPGRFDYGVRICPEPVYWGGLSGCTYSEGVSWGKFIPGETRERWAEVFSDATVAWPLIVKTVQERLHRKE